MPHVGYGRPFAMYTPYAGVLMRNMQLSHVTPQGETVFVPTEYGKQLVSQGYVGAVVCPTGQTCKQACACSGVSATGVVGVGGSCRCITLRQPPNPPNPPSRGFVQQATPYAPAQQQGTDSYSLGGFRGANPGWGPPAQQYAVQQSPHGYSASVGPGPGGSIEFPGPYEDPAEAETVASSYIASRGGTPYRR